MAFDNVCHIAEAQSIPFCIVQVAGGNAKKFFKYFMLVFAGNANTGVGYVQFKMVIASVDIDADLWMPIAVFEGIIQQVVDHTYQV